MAPSMSRQWSHPWNPLMTPTTEPNDRANNGSSRNGCNTNRYSELTADFKQTSDLTPANFRNPQSVFTSAKPTTAKQWIIPRWLLLALTKQHPHHPKAPAASSKTYAVTIKPCLYSNTLTHTLLTLKLLSINKDEVKHNGYCQRRFIQKSFAAG